MFPLNLKNPQWNWLHLVIGILLLLLMSFFLKKENVSSPLKKEAPQPAQGVSVKGNPSLTLLPPPRISPSVSEEPPSTEILEE